MTNGVLVILYISLAILLAAFVEGVRHDER